MQRQSSIDVAIELVFVNWGQVVQWVDGDIELIEE
jgi:hypothetical protein